MSTDEDVESLKAEIISSMAQVEDKHHRIVLSLMIRIMGTQERFINEIFTKLDSIIQDEQRIKEIALNGYSKDHPSHHLWVQTKMAAERENNTDIRKFVKSTIGKLIFYGILVLLGMHAEKIFPKLFGDL